MTVQVKFPGMVKGTVGGTVRGMVRGTVGWTVGETGGGAMVGWRVGGTIRGTIGGWRSNFLLLFYESSKIHYSNELLLLVAPQISEPSAGPCRKFFFAT